MADRLLPGARLVGWTVASMLALVAAPLPAAGDPKTPADSEWEFSIVPYLWAISIDASIEADGTSADADLAFSDILSDLDFGGLVAFEARRGRLSLLSNLNYLKLGVEENAATGPEIPVVPPGSLDVEVEMQTLIFEQFALWEAYSAPLFGRDDERRASVQLGPAFRYVWLDNEIDVKLRPGAPLGPFRASFDGSRDWIDFVLAGRLQADLSDAFALALTGDLGGFDIGSSSHRTWSLGGAVRYRLGEHWDLVGGWRHLEIEQDQADLVIDGPLLGASYTF